MPCSNASEDVFWMVEISSKSSVVVGPSILTFIEVKTVMVMKVVYKDSTPASTQ